MKKDVVSWTEQQRGGSPIETVIAPWFVEATGTDLDGLAKGAKEWRNVLDLQ